MHIAVAKRVNKTFPWGVEIELFNDRCIYMSANSVVICENKIDVIINDSNVISIPKKSIRKILIMGSETEDEPKED